MTRAADDKAHIETGVQPDPLIARWVSEMAELFDVVDADALDAWERERAARVPA